MRKLLFLCALPFLMACASAGAVLLSPPTKPAQALQTNVGIDSLMGSACVTGWTRVAPHICSVTARPTPAALSNANVCSALDMHAGFNIPTTSSFSFIEINNAGSALFVFTDAACANTAVGYSVNVPTYPARVISGNIYYKTASASASISPQLYYD